MNRRALLKALGLGPPMGLLSGDTASLFAPTPKGVALDVMYRQGTITEWNPVTLENTVEVDGALLTDLPVLGVAEAASYAAGNVVGLHLMKPTDGGAETWAIVGRFVTPGTQGATDALTQLGSDVVNDFIATTESTTSSPFVDLATVGPTVSVTVKASGKVLLFLNCTILSTVVNAGTLYGGFMNVNITGANTISPGSIPGGLGHDFSSHAAAGMHIEISFTRLIPLTGLTPGLTTFQAKYAVAAAVAGASAQFRNRSLVVFAL